MSMVATFLKINAGRIAESVQEASVGLDSSNGEMTLDFSDVRRIDPKTLKAMEDLARLGEQKAVKIRLVGVSVEIYKVLKLAKLGARFHFVA